MDGTVKFPKLIDHPRSQVTVQTPCHKIRILRDIPKLVWQDRVNRYASVESLAGDVRTAKCNFPDTILRSSTTPPSVG
jgi:hypothetical protein